MRKLAAVATIALATATLSARADVKLPAIISDNMCLQANHALPIWGKADPGEQVKVTLGEQTASATAGDDGKWQVVLKAIPAGNGPLELKVDGKNHLDVKNVIVGEVWVASGQSNMEFGFNGAHNAAEERPKANYPKIRLFTVKKKIAFQPEWDCEGKWEECSPSTVDHTSAVGYFFARDVHTKLGVPVGLIHTSWGGTPAEAWTSHEQLESIPELKGSVVSAEEARTKYQNVDLPRYEQQEKQWKEKYGEEFAQERKAYEEAVKEAKAEGKPAPQFKPTHAEPRKPNPPEFNPNLPSVLYNGMIAPLIPFGIEGAIWYQGESNAGNPKGYRVLFPAMITDWRNRWTAINPDEKDFTFCFVQLANFMQRLDQPFQDDGGWPGLREAQHMTLKLPNTGEAVIIDIGQANDIHPKDKMDVGKRLALAAMKVAYHQDVVFSGPTLRSMKVDGNKATLTFDNVGSGLTIAAAPSTQPGVPQVQPLSEIKGFSIAGDDHHFVWAQAKITAPDTITVWSDQVSNPAAVRYAWANNPECNLYNKEGLPASPFRTDDWGAPAKAQAKK